MRRILLVLVCMFGGVTAFAQPVYNMDNNTVTDCEGRLLDSDANTEEADHYAHNEHFVFTICPPNADSITLTFLDFGIEECCDTLQIFDGADTNSTLLGKFTGTDLPGPLLAQSGCITIKFESDKDVSDIGWIADWETITEEPEPPQIIATNGASCFSNTFTLTLDTDIPCDSVYGDLFSVAGPSAVEVASATPLNCSGGTTNQIELTLAPSFSDNGIYNIVYNYRHTDICGYAWQFDIQGTTEVTDCPLSAEIIASTDTICEGDCVQLTGDATGGDASTYQYSWSNGVPPGPGPHTVCPVATTTYQVTVTDATASPQDVATQQIVVMPRPDAGSNQTLCRYDPPITLSGSPAGGSWNGDGIIDGQAGTFDPTNAEVGINQVWYEQNECADTIEIEVLLSWAGGWEAACPGAAPFEVSGGVPSGGTWSGPNITASGTFDPASPGSYSVTYTAPNGCEHSKTINVQNISLDATDTTCTSVSTYDLDASPFGGRWSGPGIVNSYTGEFDPNEAGTGEHTITYTLEGCSQTMEVYVQQINARWNQVYCPTQPHDTLPPGIPSGGTWSGDGIVNSSLGVYDPGWNNGNNFTTPVVYHLEGCTDTITAYGRQTRIYTDTLYFCASDSALQLNWAGVKRTPGNGNWSGAGITDPNYPGTFDPKVAGAGIHNLVYDANGCSDSVIMVVHALPSLQADTTVCNQSGEFTLQAAPAGGLWNGSGITDANAGIFDPQSAGLGFHNIEYSGPQGCLDSMEVEVEPLQSISIEPIAPYFCYADTSVVLRATPEGGSFAGPGITDSTFNPVLADSGTHTIFYHYGSGECAVEDSFEVTVGAPLTLTINFSEDSICFGSVSRMAASIAGGGGSNYQFNWSHNLGNKDSVIADPAQSTTYTVTATDGCSEPVSEEIYVHVFPEIKSRYTSGPKVCYGETSFVTGQAVNGGNYQFAWQTQPATVADTLFETAGDYFVAVTDLNSGCQISESATIDGYDFIKAQFSINPSDECTTILESEISIIDNSEGGITGTFDFGDGTTVPYHPGEYLTHTYQDTGHYQLQLYMENEGGCADSFATTFCVEPAATLFAPTAFTPDGDGRNDQFKVRGIGIQDFRMMIFNRWGEKIFESNNIANGWDGSYQGEMAPNDVYTYLIIYEDMTSPRPKKKKGTFALIR